MRLAALPKATVRPFFRDYVRAYAGARSNAQVPRLVTIARVAHALAIFEQHGRDEAAALATLSRARLPLAL
jgi:hypothetical protein